VTAPGSATAGPVTAAQLTIVPANQASWAALEAYPMITTPGNEITWADFAQRAARPRSRVSTARRA
jgi:hypothetical protein